MRHGTRGAIAGHQLSGEFMKHYFDQVQGWFNGLRLYRDAVTRAHNGSILVEVGAWKGRSTSFMGVEVANSGKKIDFFTVDTWLGSATEAAQVNDPDVQKGVLFDVFRRNIASIEQYVRPIRCKSVEAAEEFGDGSIDFIYLDAGHTYDDVRSDLAAWWPKLKRGGIIAGDDWEWQDSPGDFSIRRAVLEFCKRHGQIPYTRPGYPQQSRTQWVIHKNCSWPIRIYRETVAMLQKQVSE